VSREPIGLIAITLQWDFGFYIRAVLENGAVRPSCAGNLKERIQALRSKVVLPAELFDGLSDIRLLGNDAAHVESKDYDTIGKEEVEVGIDFTKHVLQAVYQYKSLLSKLAKLKKPSTTP
jgi:Domain of unknown function (DUF4145)